jgi:hypothetical protein
MTQYLLAVHGNEEQYAAIPPAVASGRRGASTGRASGGRNGEGCRQGRRYTESGMSVMNMCPGACVIAKGGFEAIRAA